jgi:hypothetical protein
MVKASDLPRLFVAIDIGLGGGVGGPASSGLVAVRRPSMAPMVATGGGEGE